MKELVVEDLKMEKLDNGNGTAERLTDRIDTRPPGDSGSPGVTQVTEWLYVCGAHALLGGLRGLRPGALVSAAPELPDVSHLAHVAHLAPPTCARVPLLDTPHTDIYPYLDQVADLIHEAKANGERTLVHCVAGVSRSVTLCLAYLVKWEKMTLRDAYHYLKTRRPQIRPNTGFFKQLIKFEERLCGEATVKMVYCEVIDKDIPDVYEPDYQGMAWYRQRYGPIERT